MGSGSRGVGLLPNQPDRGPPASPHRCPARIAAPVRGEPYKRLNSPEETSLARFPTSGTRAHALQFKANIVTEGEIEISLGGEEEKKEKKQTRS